MYYAQKLSYFKQFSTVSNRHTRAGQICPEWSLVRAPNNTFLQKEKSMWSLHFWVPPVFVGNPMDYFGVKSPS